MKFASLALVALIATTAPASARCGGIGGYCHYKYYSTADIGEWDRKELEDRYKANDAALQRLQVEAGERSLRLPIWLMLAAFGGLAFGVAGTVLFMRQTRP